MNNRQKNYRFKIGVLTSGGDSPGMNAAVRAIVRSATKKNIKVYGIYDGYEGMIRGGIKICKLKWEDVGNIISLGGTVLGTTRCDDFEKWEGRLKAAENLIKNGIDRLIIIGGDGSLNGGLTLYNDWPKLLKYLVKNKRIDESDLKRYPHIYIVGLPSSIDNDICGTEFTIGADSALHRINEAVDAISSTSASHKRTFIIKTMGRNCGWLALMGAIISGADWVFTPENPPAKDEWKKQICDALRMGKREGRSSSIIILAEGAIDKEGTPITDTDIQNALSEELGMDSRISVLGHQQRGGTPSAFDRTMSTRFGYAAVENILSSSPTAEPVFIGLIGNRIHCISLERSLNSTKKIASLASEKKFEGVRSFRGKIFLEASRINRLLISQVPRSRQNKHFNFAVLHVGTPTPGMNTAVRAVVRLAINDGHKVYGVKRGFNGLVDGNIEEMSWMRVNDIAQMGGAELGSSQKIPGLSDFLRINQNLEKFQIQGLLIIGGWTGYQGALQLFEKRELFEKFKMPVICIPATISNNIPGTDVTIGSDTALNNIMISLDKIKQSSVSSRRCFIIEVGGGYNGYLALISGLISGGEKIYLHEEGININDLIKDLKNLKKEFSKNRRRLALMIRNEKAYRSYDNSFMTAFFKEGSDEIFEVYSSIVGPLQYEGNPSPLDRILATIFAYHSINELIRLVRNRNEEYKGEYKFVGYEEGKVVFKDLENFQTMVNELYQRPSCQWWKNELQPVIKAMIR